MESPTTRPLIVWLFLGKAAGSLWLLRESQVRQERRTSASAGRVAAAEDGTPRTPTRLSAHALGHHRTAMQRTRAGGAHRSVKARDKGGHVRGGRRAQPDRPGIARQPMPGSGGHGTDIGGDSGQRRRSDAGRAVCRLGDATPASPQTRPGGAATAMATISNDGAPLPAEPTGGLGRRQMRIRAALFGAQLALEPGAAGRGARARLRLTATPGTTTATSLPSQ